MRKQLKVSLLDLVMCLSDSMDLVSQDLINHHKRVAYLAFKLANQLGLSKKEQNTVLLAGALHDFGAFSLEERIETLKFEFESPHRHAWIGYILLKKFEPFLEIANLIRYHHVPWDRSGVDWQKGKVPLESGILHLADRVDILIDHRKEILSQYEIIVARIEERTGTLFDPSIVEGFKQLAAKEYFWFELTSNSVGSNLVKQSGLEDVKLDLDALLDFAKFLAQTIDVRCHFTSTHSWGVAAVSGMLGEVMGFSLNEIKMLKTAGYFHDLGKLAIPEEIIDYPGALSQNQYNIIKSHVFYTFNVLSNVDGLELINEWASLHHERLDGSGYPFHYRGEELSLGSRIVAVADVFTALTEDRPYRKGMDKLTVLKSLFKMAKANALDANVVNALRKNYKTVDSTRITAQKEAHLASQEFWEEIDKFNLR